MNRDHFNNSLKAKIRIRGRLISLTTIKQYAYRKIPIRQIDHLAIQPFYLYITLQRHKRGRFNKFSSH